MNWWDALPGSGLEIREARIDDVRDVVLSMDNDTFCQHFDKHQKRGDAIFEAQRYYLECARPLAIVADGRVVYVFALYPTPGLDICGLLWGLPGRDFERHATKVAHWFRRRYLAHARANDMLPIATAAANVLDIDRWLATCGAVAGMANGHPAMVWEH